jgi:peptidoglycan hydrolase CwlO-like protein
MAKKNDKEPTSATQSILCQIQRDVAELKVMRQEVREGFASIDANMAALLESQLTSLKARLDKLEADAAVRDREDAEFAEELQRTMDKDRRRELERLKRQ